MPSGEYKRKLTAILSADVQGYSRMMGEDEDSTIRTLTGYRELMSTLIQKHRGRVVDSPGDNLLAEFGSVVDAVRCAVEIQEELKVRNDELPENRRMVFRIGINLGDVVAEGERIYGDGVNIAARVEGLADGGGICISGTVYDSIKNKLSLSYEPMGEHTVKNIKEPIRVYRMRIGPEVTVPAIGDDRQRLRMWKKMAVIFVAVLVLMAGTWAIWNFYLRAPKIEPASMPDKPSIAVLPFGNLSGDPDQEYFSDGISEEIINALVRWPSIKILPKSSSFVYKDKNVDVRQVGHELGVRYVLDGSVRREGNRVRVAVQLIDAATRKHLFSERYEREMKDVFAIQDEITMGVLAAMRVSLSGEGVPSLRGRPTKSIDAYLKVLQAEDIFKAVNRDTQARAERLAREAVALDPEYARAHAILAGTIGNQVLLGVYENREEALERAIAHADRAIQLDDSENSAHRVRGFLALLNKDYERAIQGARRAVELAPNSVMAQIVLAYFLYSAGRTQEAIPILEKAAAFTPIPNPRALSHLGIAYRKAGRHEEAVNVCIRLIQLKPNYIYPHLTLAASFAEMDKMEEARAEIKEVLRINPKYNIEIVPQSFPWKDQGELERLSDSLLKAGLPETPPLPLPDKPSIAVLPFVNISGDPEQEYFSDGITEEIITALSKTKRMFVIARNSTFFYKGKPVKVQQVGRELGVKYVLEGSIRKSEDRIRISAQLIDATDGNSLWAERYDRPLGDIFDIEDEITLAIVRAMRVNLTEGEQASLTGRGTKDLDAYLKAMQAQEQFNRMNNEGSAKAKKFAKAAIAIDPNYALPYTTLANAHMLDAWFKFSSSPRKSMELAAEAARKALSLDDSDPNVYSTLTNLYVMQRRYSDAISTAKRDLEINPGGARTHLSMGLALLFACRFSEAIPFFEQALRLNPYPPHTYYRLLGSAYRLSGHFGQAIDEYKKSLRLEPNDLFTRLGLIVAYVKQGRDQNAKDEAHELLRIHPGFSVGHFTKTLSLKDQSVVDDMAASLRKAGLK